MMRRLLRVWFLLALSVSIPTLPAVGQTDPNTADSTVSTASAEDEFQIPVDAQQRGRIENLIALLGAKSFNDREQATLDLIEIGAPAFTSLRQAYHASDQLEVHLRIERIAHTSYIQHHVYGRNAFLGIQQSRIPKTSSDDPRIAEGKFGIQVGKILPNTAAEDAKLAKNDIIVSVDGEDLGGQLLGAAGSFGESIRLRGPGTVVRLGILRGDKELEFSVTLRERPRIHYNQRQGLVYRMLVEADQNFRSWWTEHFQNTP